MEGRWENSGVLSRHHQVALVDGTAGKVLVVDGGLPRHPGPWPWAADLQPAVGAPAAVPVAAPWRAAYPDVDLAAVRARVPLAEAVFQAITYEQIHRAQPERPRWEPATFVGRYIDILAGLRDDAAKKVDP
ncbi:hypothetical protein GCM10010472_68520 [Pseudonocardia halophobica]|uniref:Uncharacterized protein n=1 Tax=Pseudonocardia halophobica TaxID=29401 RepID=A0A9W6L7L9_9PSEU|nr:hypothetical protein [Pseudonocardia halophobica]GLL12579.1 hypothetical protein GCM10017577_37200 [Pseudonocardia halophobica]